MPARPGYAAALAVLVLAGPVDAEPPDLSGRWSLVIDDPAPGATAEPARVPATASSGWGREITIAREDGRITIQRHQFVENDMQPPMRFAYALGGAESRNVVDMGRGPQEQVARATLEGDALVIVTRHPAGTDAAAEVRQAFSLDPTGALVVETTRTARGLTSTTRSRYRRLPAR